MTKTMIAALIAAASTTGAVYGATEMIDNLAPQAAQVSSDVNLKQAYTKIIELEGLQGYSREEAMQAVAEAFTNETVTFTVEGGNLVARTDWSCRSLVEGPVAVKIVDC